MQFVLSVLLAHPRFVKEVVVLYQVLEVSEAKDRKLGWSLDTVYV